MTISTIAKEAAERILRRVNDPRGNALYLHEAAEIVQAAIAAEVEQAYREGYVDGYGNGSNDCASYERGGGSNRHAKRDQDEAWESSNTRQLFTSESKPAAR